MEASEIDWDTVRNDQVVMIYETVIKVMQERGITGGNQVWKLRGH